MAWPRVLRLAVQGCLWVEKKSSLLSPLLAGCGSPSHPHCLFPAPGIPFEGGLLMKVFDFGFATERNPETTVDVCAPW